MVAPIWSDGEGAETTIDVTVVGDGSVGPSLHATANEQSTATDTTFFMSTLFVRERGVARRAGRLG